MHTESRYRARSTSTICAARTQDVTRTFCLVEIVGEDDKSPYFTGIFDTQRSATFQDRRWIDWWIINVKAKFNAGVARGHPPHWG